MIKRDSGHGFYYSYDEQDDLPPVLIPEHDLYESEIDPKALPEDEYREYMEERSQSLTDLLKDLQDLYRFMGSEEEQW